MSQIRKRIREAEEKMREAKQRLEGFDLPWDDLGALVRRRVEHVIIFGEAAPKIAAAIGERKPGSKPFSIVRCANLREAVAAAARLAQPGYVVLFSPGGTSFDEFRDF